MKILIVTNMYPTAEHPFNGVFIKDQELSLKGLGLAVDIYHINGRQNRHAYVTAFYHLPRLLAAKQFDLIHVHHTYCVYPAAWARMLARCRVPLIFTFHESEFLMPKYARDWHEDFVKQLLYVKRIKRKALHLVDVAIPVWGGLTRALKYRGREFVIPCGIDLDLFKVLPRDNCRNRLKMDQSAKVVFFPANVADFATSVGKGYDLFLRAIDELTKTRRDFIVVQGGNIPHVEMPYWMNAADVVVSTSVTEASPMVIKEAMAANTPIVATDAGDTGWVFGSTEGCYLCARDTEDIARKIDLALKYGTKTRGRDRIEELGLGLQATARKLLAVYRETLKNYEA